MINQNYKKAFTLVELLTVVVIIGMIASTALIMVRDTGEVKAKSHTKEVAKRIKDGIIYKEDTDNYTGFLNDFGVVPPNPYFLLNKEADTTNYQSRVVANTDTDGNVGKAQLFKFRESNLYSQYDNDGNTNNVLTDSEDFDAIRYPAPFMEYCNPSSREHITGTYICTDNDFDGDGTPDIDTDSNGDDEVEITKKTPSSTLPMSPKDNEIKISSMFGGYQFDYLEQDGDSEGFSLKDGWNTPFQFTNNLQIEDSDSDGYVDNPFLEIRSLGSDKIEYPIDTSKQFIKEEFDETKDNGSLKELYAEDLIKNYKTSEFMPAGIESIIIDLQNDTTYKEFDGHKIAVVIYSPMLYYVEDSDVDSDGNDEKDTFKEYDTIQAENSVDGSKRNYTPFLPYHEAYLEADWKGKNLSWQVGIAKYSFIFSDTPTGGTDSDNIIDTIELKINDTDVAKDYPPVTANDNIPNSRFFTGTNIFDITYYHSTTPPNRTVARDINTPHIDDANPFYITAGEKQIVLFYHNGTSWNFVDSFSQVFKPNEKVEIKYTAPNP